MKDHPLLPLASRFRPELKRLEGASFLQAFSEVLIVLYLAPVAALGIVGLIVAGGNAPTRQDLFLLGC